MKTRIASLMLALLALALPVQAGVGVWTPLGPDGATVRELLVDPTDSRILYAGTETSGVFRSIDGGESWAPSSAGIGAGGRDIAIRSLAADPHRPGTVYAGTVISGVFKSVDGGRLWTAASAGLPPSLYYPGEYRAVHDLVVDPRDSQWIYAATAGGLFASADGGTTWKPRGRGLPKMAVTALAAEPLNGRLWAGLPSGEIFASLDQGASWTASVRGLPIVHSLAVDSDHPGVVVAGTFQGLYRTANGGRRWARVGAGAPTSLVQDVAFQPSTGWFYAAARGVFFSRDGGLTWQRAKGGPSDPIILAFAAGPRAVYAGTSGTFQQGGVFRSQDGGLTWRFHSRGLSTLEVSDVAVDPGDPERLYATVAGLGVFHSTDRGASWTRLAVPEHYSRQVGGVAEIFIDPARPSTIYVQLFYSVLRSDDGGDTWRQVVPEAGYKYWNTMALDLRAPDALWAGNVYGSYSGGLSHSADGGVTWINQTLSSEASVQNVEPDPRDPRIVFAAGDNRVSPQIFRSLDGGQTWEHRRVGTLEKGRAVQLAFDPGEPGTVYAAVSPKGLYRSPDRGDTWELLLNREVHFVAVSPTAIYAATSLGDVLRSDDRGATWTSIRCGLGWRVVNRLVVDPHDQRRLYAVTPTGGIYTYTEPE